jgi:predicted DNA-binding transcriptional regulator AlpA
MNEQDAMSIGEFCQRYGISRSSFYLLKKASEAPRLMQVGDRVLISKEAAAEWRRERELAQLKRAHEAETGAAIAPARPSTRPRPSPPEKENAPVGAGAWRRKISKE